MVRRIADWIIFICCMVSQRLLLGLALLAALSVDWLVPARAAEFKTVELSDKTEIKYALVLPEGYRKDEVYPFIFALPPGQQDQAMVEAGIRVYWEEEARRRGVIVVSPVAPGGTLFFKGSEKHIPEFLGLLQEEFGVADGAFHLTGVSNGGVAAFRVALLYPEFFQSMTVLPGFPPTPAGHQYFWRLNSMRISMFVGEHDDGFRKPMELAQQAFADNGMEIHMEIIPDEGHFLRSLSGPNAGKLFDRILN